MHEPRLTVCVAPAHPMPFGVSLINLLLLRDGNPSGANRRAATSRPTLWLGQRSPVRLVVVSVRQLGHEVGVLKEPQNMTCAQLV